MTVKEIVTLKGAEAKFDYAIAGCLYYTIDHPKFKITFPIDMNDKSDVGTTTFMASYRPIELMRYIRKAIESNSLIVSNRNLDVKLLKIKRYAHGKWEADYEEEVWAEDERDIDYWALDAKHAELEVLYGDSDVEEV